MFKKKESAVSGTPHIAALMRSINEQVHISAYATPAIARTAIATEGYSEADTVALSGAYDSLKASLESVIGTMGLQAQVGFTAAQMESAAAAGIMAGDPQAFLRNKLTPVMESNAGMAVVQFPANFDGSYDRKFAAEAYDERENRQAAMFSITYNMQCAKQDEFGETLFPTIAISPEQAGIGISTNLLLVYDAIERKISADVTDYAKKNVVRAIVDSTILRKDATKAIPVYRAQAADKFVDQAVVAARDVMIDNEAIKTAPVKFGKDVDYIQLSTIDSLLAQGTMNMTDSIDPTVTLTHVFAKFGADVLKFDVANVPGSNFTYMPQSNYREMQVFFETTSILLNKNTKCADGGALVDLAGVVTDDLIIRLKLNITGKINIETGACRLHCAGVEVFNARNADGELLPLASAQVAPIAAAIEAGAGLGYELLAYRTNANRRQRGQLIDQTRYTQFYNVPLRAPVTAIHPAHATGIEDTSDVEALMLLTRIRLQNEAVTAVLDAAEILASYVDSRDPSGVGPDVLGLSRFFVRPTFFTEALDCATLVNSLNSTDRGEDLQNALVNKIRDYAYQMYRDSEYKPASDALSGGLAPVPEVVIFTDPVIARYLTLTGDLRTMGNLFKVRVVHSFDSRMKGRIGITFGVFDENRNSQPNIMNFGNMLWAPELVLVGPMARDNTLSKEATVSPRYLFITHLPVMTMLTVANIPEVFDSLPISVTP